MNNRKLAPFLKWPGGKRWFISKYCDLIPTQYNHYFEPFIGGGSVFFRLLPDSATISDINPELINLYITMRDNPDDLKEVLLYHQYRHCKDYYYSVRACETLENIEKAGRFLYLNRTCYNGMYRVNQQGKFNVPIGTKDNCTYDLNLFTEYSNALKGVRICTSDFGTIIKEAGNKDLIFVDPPYTIAHNQNSFIKYNEHLFTWADQERLLNELNAAKTRGAMIFATNANYRTLREMYIEHGFYVRVIERYSAISGKSDKRGKQEELLITSIPIMEG